MNYACKKGSDEHCKKDLGNEYCCAQYRSLAQSKPTYAYICTKVDEILESSGKIEEDLVEGIIYTVMCANARNIFYGMFSVSIVALVYILNLW